MSTVRAQVISERGCEVLAQSQALGSVPSKNPLVRGGFLQPELVGDS